MFRFTFDGSKAARVRRLVRRLFRSRWSVGVVFLAAVYALAVLLPASLFTR